MVRLVEVRRSNISLYNVGSRRSRHDVGQPCRRVDARICIVAVPAAIMVFDDVDDFLEGIEPLEMVVAEGTCQLATQLGVLSHSDYEMRLAFWRGLGHHGGSRGHILDN